MAMLSCMMSRKNFCQGKNHGKDLPATEPLIQQQHILSCMICHFVPSTMCLLELTLKQVLDPIVNLWYYKHQVSTSIYLLFRTGKVYFVSCLVFKFFKPQWGLDNNR